MGEAYSGILVSDCYRHMDLIDTIGFEPTNNAAESALRPAVIWRKTSFWAPSKNGSQFVARSLTVPTSLKVQKRNSLDFLTQACLANRAGTQLPSVLPQQHFEGRLRKKGDRSHLFTGLELARRVGCNLYATFIHNLSLICNQVCQGINRHTNIITSRYQSCSKAINICTKTAAFSSNFYGFGRICFSAVN